MSKNHFYLLFLLSFIFCVPLQAQDTTKHIRNEIAIDVSPVFAGIMSTSSTPGISYRRHYEKGALRVRLNLNGGKSEDKNTSATNQQNIPSSSAKNTSASLKVGYQWHRDYTKLRWYYGLDLLASNWKSKNANSNTSRHEFEKYTSSYSSQNETTGQSFGISPVIGLSYRITRRFSLSVESAITLARTSSKTTIANNQTTQYDGYPQNQFESGYSNKSTGTNYSFVPMNGLLVSYLF